jgi:hypothetical protein
MAAQQPALQYALLLHMMYMRRLRLQPAPMKQLRACCRAPQEDKEML